MNWPAAPTKFGLCNPCAGYGMRIQILLAAFQTDNGRKLHKKDVRPPLRVCPPFRVAPDQRPAAWGVRCIASLAGISYSRQSQRRFQAVIEFLRHGRR